MKKIIFIFLFFINSLAYDIINIIPKEDFSSFKQQSILQQQFIPLDQHITKDYIPLNTNLNNLLDSKQKRLFKDTAYLQVFMFATVGFLYMLPPSITKWEEDPNDTRTIWNKWVDHVKKGPVWDKDDFAINYIGHPISGAWYYMVAREDGYSPFHSFLYSFCLSTFFWEYGYEAFAEIPSIQDLIFTPGIGAFIGEGFWNLQNQLDKNNGILFGSKTLGNIAYFLLNPIKRITSGIDKTLNIHVTFQYTVYNPQILLDKSYYLRKIDYIPKNYGFMLTMQF